uniref:Pyrin domain-containing protein n=1 Tax=Hucho hucho TaxID=62062 RepID=A0A4W5QI89_9TELE
MDRFREVAASEKERKPAGEESEEPSSELPSTSSGMSTLYVEKRDLETEISMLKEKLRFMKRMLDVPALLLTTLEELTEEQLKTFQSNLTSVHLPGFPPITDSQLENTDRQVTVDQMVKRHGPERAVRNTLRILRWMKLDALAEQLQRDYSGDSSPVFPSQALYPSSAVMEEPYRFLPSSVQHSLQRPPILAVPALLLTTLEKLCEEQLKTFQWYLTRGWLPGYPPIPRRQLRNADRQDTVDQMVKRYGPVRAVKNTLMILRWMNLDDLAEQLERDHTRALLLNTLEELNINELKTFQNYLTSGQLPDCPPIPESQLENTDRQDIVDQMVKKYDPERAVKITLMILRWMNEHDLTEKFQSDHTEPSGLEKALEILRKMNWDLSENLERERFLRTLNQ